MQKFIINDRLNSLNDYTDACRTNQYKGSDMKKQNERVVMFYINQCRMKKVEKYPIKVKINWYEKNRRRDIDNITFATKFILDSLVKTGIIVDDSQKYVHEIEHHVHVDKENPRIEVQLLERENDNG